MFLNRFKPILLSLVALGLALGLGCSAAVAIAPADFSAQRPENRIIDEADVLSRSSRAELDRRLEDFGAYRLDARLVTLRRLDYGFTLDGFGRDLIDQWTVDGDPSNPLLLLLIETQNKRAVVVADPALKTQLPDSLLSSTGRTTMAIPLREGERFRQSSLDGLNRLSTVLNGGEDPGPPEDMVRPTIPTNIPTQEETHSNATTWIIVLLVWEPSFRWPPGGCSPAD